MKEEEKEKEKKEEKKGAERAVVLLTDGDGILVQAGNRLPGSVVPED